MDAVSIATPPNTHYQIAMEAIQAGKQVNEIEIRRFQHVRTYHPDFITGWILKKEIGGGGIVIDDGTNFIASTICALEDKIDFAVTNANMVIPDGMEVETQADIDFKFGENGRVTCKCSGYTKAEKKRQLQ